MYLLFFTTNHTLARACLIVKMKLVIGKNIQIMNKLVFLVKVGDLKKKILELQRLRLAICESLFSFI